MGMTIDKAITVLGMVEAHGVCIEAKEIAVETMRKYQDIEKILDNWNAFKYDDNEVLRLISELVYKGDDIK